VFFGDSCPGINAKSYYKDNDYRITELERTLSSGNYLSASNYIRNNPDSKNHSLLIFSQVGLTTDIKWLLGEKRGGDLIDESEYIQWSIQEETFLFFDLHARNNYQNTQLVGENIANINTVNENGETLLMIASKFGRYHIAQLLISRNVNIEAQDRQGMTAIMHAAQAGSRRIVELFLHHGAQLEFPSVSGTSNILHFVNKCDNEQRKRRVLDFLFEVRPLDMEKFKKKYLFGKIRKIFEFLLISFNFRTFNLIQSN